MTENSTGKTERRGLFETSHLLHAVAALFLLYAFFLALKPLSSNDLWFHLSSGKWMVQNRALLGTEDPFSYTTGEIPEHKLGQLRNQWLAQVIFYLLYAAGGLPALVVAKGLLIVLPFLWLYVILVRQKTHPAVILMIISFPLLSSSVVIGSFFERPQAFSFVISVFVVYLLERLKAGRSGRAAYAVLPLLMVLWANLHGAYIVGVVIIAGYMAAEGVGLLAARLKRFHGPEGRGAKVSWRFFAVCTAAVAASFLNPDTYHTLVSMFSVYLSGLLIPAGQRASYVAQQMWEYRSLWFIHEYFYVSWPLYFIAFIAIVVVAVVTKYIRARSVDLSEFAAILMIGFLSIYYVRAVPFSVYVFPLFLGLIASSFRKYWKVVTAGSVLCLCLVFAVMERTSFRLVPSAPKGWVLNIFPEGAIRFLKGAGIEGPIYNPVHWGGYIIFRAYPDYKVFVDERSISQKVLEEAHVITNAGPGWSILLDRYGVNAVIIPLIAKESRDTVPLARALAADDAWKLVYLREDTAVFVRGSGPNGDIVRRYEISKNAIWEEMLRVSQTLLMREPGNPLLHMARTEALINLRRYMEAKEAAALTRKTAKAVGGQRARQVLIRLSTMGY